MNSEQLIRDLSCNRAVFEQLFNSIPSEAFTWKPAPDKWCMLEVACHLYDEEREDFRARTMSVLEDPNKPLVKIDPTAWVKERDYMSQDFRSKTANFLEERDRSVRMLEALENPKWSNTYQHPKMGSLSAYFFLSNWVAHDLLHFRQIIRLRFAYMAELSGEKLDYAGPW